MKQIQAQIQKISDDKTEVKFLIPINGINIHDFDFYTDDELLNLSYKLREIAENLFEAAFVDFVQD